MADMTKTEVADLVLEHLGIKSITQRSSTGDNKKAQVAVQSAYEQLRKLRLCPFAVSAVPEWAQISLAKYTALDLANAYGKDAQEYSILAADRRSGLHELQAAVSGYRQPQPVKSRFY